MLSSRMRGMLANFHTDTFPGQVEFRRLLGSFLGIILTLAESRLEAELHRHPKRCQKAIGHLQQNYDQELNIDQLAQLCGVSRPSFFRLFREETAQTAQQYLCRLRLDQAKNLLRFTDMRIAEVGRKVGWPDPFHFSRMFSRETGCSPSAFRTRNLT